MLGFAGELHWLLELFSHFRVQYAAGLGIVGLLLLARRRRVAGVLALVFAGVNAWLVVPLYRAPTNEANGHGPPLRVLTLNVNARRGSPQRVLELINHEAPDLFTLQEVTPSWVAALQPLERRYPNHELAPRQDNFGIALYSRWPIEDVATLQLGGAGLPSLAATIVRNQERWRVVATHPPPPISARLAARRDQAMAALADSIDPAMPTLVLGDLNATVWSPQLANLLATSGLMSSAAGFGLQPTWPNGLPLLYIAIDHVLHSPDIITMTHRRGFDVGSDHLAVIADVAQQAE